MRVTHHRIQFGVGQGSFHAASVRVESTGPDRVESTVPEYVYVYDCGGLSWGRPTRALSRSIGDLALSTRKERLLPTDEYKPVIDALVISHFDQDHMNGIKELNAKCMVKRVFLPYLGQHEWLLLLACHGGEFTIESIRELHAVATTEGNGQATLFGIPVTRVRPGSDSLPEPAGRDNPDRRPDALDLLATVGNQGAPVGATLDCADSVYLGSSQSPQNKLWKLRFWNRGVDPNFRNALSQKIADIGFPIDQLTKPVGVDILIDWLATKANLKQLRKAYRDAIGVFAVADPRARSWHKSSNFLSMTLYSGSQSQVGACYWNGTLDHCLYPDVFNRLRRRFPLIAPLSKKRTGWFGTGDAPLGDAAHWQGFAAHYAQELSDALTVQVPHHGAAPRWGPQYFNRGLFPAYGMHAVVSAGARNSYKHPRGSVVREIARAGAHLQLVTELGDSGFHECIVFS